MKKLYLLFLIPFLLGADIPTPPKDDKLSTETQQYLNTIYEELKRDNAETGLKLPKGAIFFMLTGNCPTGSTDITTTYSDKFIRINATQGTIGGSDTITLAEVNLPSHTHGVGTLVAGEESAHTHSLLVKFTEAVGTAGSTNPTGVTPYVQSGPGSAHTHTLSGSTAAVGSGTAVTITNPFLTCKLCQVN